MALLQRSAVAVVAFIVTASAQVATLGQVSVVAQHLQPQLSTPCQGEMQGMLEESRKSGAAKCENEKGYDEKVLRHLQVGEEAEAVSVTEASFRECAHFSLACAGEVAPGVVQEIRLSGLAVNNSCRTAMGSAQEDEKLMAAAHQCEQAEKVSEKLMGAVNVGNLDDAIDSAHFSLASCMKLPDNCAFQYAPVLVNQVVTMAMMQQTGMMPVFAALKSSAIVPKETGSIITAAEELRQTVHRSAPKTRDAVSFLQRH